MPKRLNKTEFIERAILLHGYKYDYSDSIYLSNKEKIFINCPIHGKFEQKPHNHLKGYGCYDCGLKLQLENVKRVSIGDFIARSNKIHLNKYNYSLVNFKHTNDTIQIICPIHGEFSQKVYGHLSGRGCSKCNQSKGEKFIEQFLVANNIIFLTEHKFLDCKNIKPLPFDFYLPEHNTCIEFDGKQHYISNEYFKHEKFDMRQKRDQIKNEYCLKNNIHLMRIKYDEDINTKLISIL
jgi:very-short-patch-repair endonuclease